VQSKKKVWKTFHLLLNNFGPQHWWPGETAFEVTVGAILTQQTTWRNVEKAILNLKKRELLSPFAIYNISTDELAELIKPAGFYNIKTKRLKTFVNYFIKEYQGNIANMQKKKLQNLRKELLSINGIGRETADSILLYALEKPIFVIDAYTERIAYRTGIFDSKDYEKTRKWFEETLKDTEFLHNPTNNFDIKHNIVYIFQEMHALLVAEGKYFCKKKALCRECPLKSICERRDIL